MGSREDASDLLLAMGRCTDLFEKLLEIFSVQKGNEHQVVLDYHERFQASAFGGLDKEGELHRNRGIALQLLELIEENLSRALEIEQKTPSVLPEVVQSTVELEAAREISLAAVEEAIDRLQDHMVLVSSLSVSTNSFSDEIEKADGELEPSSGTPTVLVIRGLLKSRFPRLHQTVLKRLEETIMKRQHWLFSTAQATAELKSLAGSQESRDREISETSSLTSVSCPSLDHYHYALPEAPRDENDGTWSCQWCHDKIPVKKLQDNSWWRNHVFHDLKPYVCLADCKEPQIFFSRFSEWKSHMETSHGLDWIQHLAANVQWYCDIKPCSPQRAAFCNPVDLQAHVAQDHVKLELGQDIPERRTAYMMKHNIGASPWKSTFCPLCGRGVLPENEEKKHLVFDMLEYEEPSGSETGAEAVPSDFAQQEPAPQRQNATAEWLGLNSPANSVEVMEKTTRHIACELRSLALLSLQNTGVGANGAAIVALPRTDLDDSPMPEDGNASLFSNAAAVPSSFLSNDPGELDKVSMWQDEAEELPNESETSESTSSGGGLIDSIFASFVDSAFDHGREFLPAGRLHELITPGKVRRELKESAPEIPGNKINGLVDFICTKAPKVFAILVVIDLSSAIPTLLQSGFCDQNLPIPQDVTHCGGYSQHQKTTKKCEHDATLEAFHHHPFKRRSLYQFYDRQWAFLAPIFEPENADWNVNTRTVLPFVYIGHDTRLGFYSDTREAKIHPDHHRGIFPDAYKGNPLMALKELRMDSRNHELKQIFERETLVLKTLRNIRNKFMVNSVGTILRGEKRYILFPWANGGNLRDFWMGNAWWPLNPDLVLQVIRQLVGVSTALDQLHEAGWRHGDVKPENILRFRDDTTLGTLKLGDMGLAKVHDVSTQFRSSPTTTRMGTIRYEPPETIILSDQPRSRRYDIWSMGCIILEFVIWMLYGPDGLAAFNQNLFQDGTFQAFYTTNIGIFGDREAKVHPAVQLWMRHILKNSDWPQDTIIGDLVIFIEAHLLVISVEGRPENNLSPRRADAKTLFVHLSRMLEISETNQEYLFPQAARARCERPKIPDRSNQLEALVPRRSNIVLPPSS